jgi:hypothetical protein
MCQDCKRDRDIPNLLSTAALRSPLTAAGGVDVSAMRGAVSSMAPRGNKSARERGQHHQPALRLSARPSLARWWICSDCHYKNNPDLANERCVSCGHTKCQYCRPWTR